MFPPPERLAPELASAMHEVEATDALIIDLRDCPGGSPDGVMQLAGYLIPERTLVARIYSRPDDQTTEMWTTVVPGAHYSAPVPITRPINVVTGGDWEGTGVQPDIAVPGADALRAAQLAALRALPSTPIREAALRS